MKQGEKVCVLSLLCIMHILVRPHNRETLSQMQRNTISRHFWQSLRLQRRTAAVICIHIPVSNSLPDVGTGRSKAGSVCSPPVPPISMTLSAPLYTSIYTANKGPELLKRDSYLLSIAPLLSWSLLSLFAFNPLPVILYFFLWLLPSICSSFLSHWFFPLFCRFVSLLSPSSFYDASVQETPVVTVCTTALL